MKLMSPSLDFFNRDKDEVIREGMFWLLLEYASRIKRGHAAVPKQVEFFVRTEHMDIQIVLETTEEGDE